MLYDERQMPYPRRMPLIQTPAYHKALEACREADGFVFITGRAGTGKSTLLKQYLLQTSGFIPVLAPTGIAALNVQGQTIHRFFGFSPSVTPAKAKMEARFRKHKGLFQKIDTIIIDEISMVRADIMDCIDVFLRTIRKDVRPFGGVRILAFGDLYQLPPVVTPRERELFSTQYEHPYFFASGVMDALMAQGAITVIELDRIHRQSDESFINLLQAIRHNTIRSSHIEQLQQRVGKPSVPGAIVLTTKNSIADEINQRELSRLSTQERMFDGVLHGEYPDKELPTETHLLLKKGARIMCIANESLGRYVNGSLGWVEGFEKDDKGKPFVTVRLDDGQIVAVIEHTWNVYTPHIDGETQELIQETSGSFTQIPLKLAWAVTIHKSQGKTFDHVVIDLGTGAFATGQVYVALSRCTSLEGVSLVRPFNKRDVLVDPYAVEFMKNVTC